MSALIYSPQTATVEGLVANDLGTTCMAAKQIVAAMSRISGGLVGTECRPNPCCRMKQTI